MITTIFFDFDGVLTKEFNGSGNICANLCSAFPELSYDHVLDCYKAHCKKLLVEPGAYKDVWEYFCSCVGQEIPIDSLPVALRTVTPNDEMWDLVRSLHRRYKLGIITDNSSERMQLIDECMKLSQFFDPIVISDAVRALKHDETTTIFDVALKGAESVPEESVFIDNQERNLIVPAEMGMSTYWHDDKKNDISALRSVLDRWGVTVD